MPEGNRKAASGKRRSAAKERRQERQARSEIIRPGKRKVCERKLEGRSKGSPEAMRQGQGIECQTGMCGPGFIRGLIRIRAGKRRLRKKRKRAPFDQMRMSQRVQQPRLLHMQQAEKQQHRQGTAEIHAWIRHFRKKHQGRHLCSI